MFNYLKLNFAVTFKELTHASPFEDYYILVCDAVWSW
jgi:hypothetical protein